MAEELEGGSWYCHFIKLEPYSYFLIQVPFSRSNFIRELYKNSENVLVSKASTYLSMFEERAMYSNSLFHFTSLFAMLLLFSLFNLFVNCFGFR